MSRFHKSHMICSSYRHVSDYCKVNQGLSNQSRYFGCICCISLLDHDSERQWFREEVILMKILEAWIQKFLAWTKRLPVTKAKIDRLPFSRFYKLLAATVTDCPLKLILSFWYPAIRLKTKFPSLSFGCMTI